MMLLMPSMLFLDCQRSAIWRKKLCVAGKIQVFGEKKSHVWRETTAGGMVCKYAFASLREKNSPKSSVEYDFLLTELVQKEKEERPYCELLPKQRA